MENQIKPLYDLNLLILNNEAYFWDGKDYRSKFNWGKFAVAFAPYFKEIFYAVPVRTKNDDDTGVVIGGENVTFVPFPFYNSMASFVRILPKRFFDIIKIVRDSVSNSDVIFLRLPSLVAPFYLFYARRLKKPIVCNISGNILKAAAPIIKGSLKKRILARFASYGIHILTQLIVNRSLVTFTMGTELFSLYKRENNRVFPFMASLIEKDLIFEDRDDTCQYQPIRILAVIRIIPTKGIEYLIESIYYLNREGYDIQLDIVGKPDSQAYVMELKSLAAKYEIESKIMFHGYVPFGEDIFQLYRDADISVIPSLSEGLPRVIVESWAFGLPLVATRVGGIPDIVVNEANGLLVAPKSGQEIYKAIKKIIDDENLRKKLIRNGLEFAKSHTKEKQVFSMVKIMEQYLGLRLSWEVTDEKYCISQARHR